MMSDMRMLLSGMAEAKQGRWNAGCVSGSFEGGVSGWLSCCSVVMVGLAGCPVPRGGVELFLIVCSGLVPGSA